MDKKYYIALMIALLLSSLFPILFYIYLDDNKVEHNYIETEYYFEHVEGAIQPIPRSMTIDKDWLILGKALFHSPLLSKDNTISCSSCHMVDFGGDDGFPLSLGVNNAQGVRNSPTVLNASLNFRQFWDGRASSLAEQAARPIHNPIEMATSWEEVIPKLKNNPYFSKTFNQLSPSGITADNVIKAITIYEESLITPNSPIDNYLLGDKNALTEQQIRGLSLFTDYGCSTCHQGRNIGGNIYQKLGRIDIIPEVLTHDFGRFQLTNQNNDKYVFKVPSLRNIADTAPYFHNGAIYNLSDAVRIMARTQLARELTDNEVEDIVALLQSFSAKTIKVE
ncbi:cytochrome-c peroxidase [Colwellia echini]|uniref:Cytochrome-c peroxidase n=1 Tax=Colwellia echini TaxID=1982103 RepID=A0ABY3MV82_9GAMM|nr:cytochrome-c peroxidase [Colwellia echini]TYK65099.1 cytochrome-c peroxidase [Colwellia echini]